jgi:hypothetical protein
MFSLTRQRKDVAVSQVTPTRRVGGVLYMPHTLSITSHIIIIEALPQFLRIQVGFNGIVLYREFLHPTYYRG